MMLLVKLILAHVLGDFYLQPAPWVKAKEKKGLKAYQLYLHALLHGVIIMVLVWDVSFIKWAMLLALIHGGIDALKLGLQKEATKRVYFFIDQSAHLISIYLIYSWYKGDTLLDRPVFDYENVVLITILLFLIVPTSYIIKMFISKWSPHTETSESESLQDAGKYIGILERLFVFAFVITSNWEAVGFLIAAKSVFRFGDLKEAKDRKLTEYILIGTLVSFGIAIAIGMLYNRLILP